MAEQAWRPRPCGYAHRRSGSPWVPVRPYYEGLPSVAGWVRMKGGRKTARISAGLRSRVWTRPYGPGVEDATVERREAACPQGTRHRKVQTEK